MSVKTVPSAAPTLAPRILVIVKTTIESKGRDVLYYRFRGGRIIDVISGGVSQLAVQRSDLAGTAAGGGVAAIVKRLDQVDAKTGG